MTFKKLKQSNCLRDAQLDNIIKNWSETDFGCAIAGEVGEMCNFIKKRRRLNYPKDETYKKDIMKEIGDIIIYLDLFCNVYGVNLEDCVRRKFNEVSIRKSSNIFIKK